MAFVCCSDLLLQLIFPSEPARRRQCSTVALAALYSVSVSRFLRRSKASSRNSLTGDERCALDSCLRPAPPCELRLGGEPPERDCSFTCAQRNRVAGDKAARVRAGAGWPLEARMACRALETARRVGLRETHEIGLPRRIRLAATLRAPADGREPRAQRVREPRTQPPNVASGHAVGERRKAPRRSKAYWAAGTPGGTPGPAPLSLRIRGQWSEARSGRGVVLLVNTQGEGWFSL